MELGVGHGYCDLRIDYTDQEECIKVLRRSFELGYQTVALNINVDQKNLCTKHKAKKAKVSGSGANVLLDFPEPPKIDLKESDYEALASKGKVPTVLTRLTLSFKDNDFLPIFNNSSSVKKYDLLALIPNSALALQNLLKSGFRSDIISFDTDPETASSETTVRWSRKLYMECVEKNMFFEIPYSPAIRDSGIRRRIIRQSHIYHSVGKSRKIIMTSGTSNPIELRAPHDVANLGFLFNLNEQQSQDAVGSFARDAIRSGSGRRLGPYRCIAQLKSQIKDGSKIPDEPRGSSSDEDSN